MHKHKILPVFTWVHLWSLSIITSFSTYLTDMRKTWAPNEGSPRRTWLRKDAKCSFEYKMNAQAQGKLVHTRSRRWWGVSKDKSDTQKGSHSIAQRRDPESLKSTNGNSHKNLSKKKTTTTAKNLIRKWHEFKPMGKHRACIKWTEYTLDLHHSNSADAKALYNQQNGVCEVCDTYMVKRGM